MANQPSFDDFDPEHTLARLFSCPVVGKCRADDLSILVMAAVIRGNNIEKMLRSMSPAGAAQVRALVRGYRISSRLNSRENRDDITLSRVAETLPYLTCGYLTKCSCLPVSKTKMNALMGCDSIYPDYMMHSAFASFIPKRVDSFVVLTISQAHLLHQVQFSLCINKDMTITDPQLYAKCEQFCTRRTDSDYVPEEVRMAYLVQYGTLLKEGSTLVVAPNVTKAAEVYRNLKRQARAQ